MNTLTHVAKSIKTPFGRLLWTKDKGDSNLFASQVFATNLGAIHLDGDGNVIETYDLGSGVVTHSGVRLLSQDSAITAGTATLAACKYHGVGTGTQTVNTAVTALNTAVGTTAWTGVNTNADASPNATLISTCTVTPGAVALTEWGLFNSATLSGATIWDYKTYAAINTSASDSVVYTYSLSLVSGS